MKKIFTCILLNILLFIAVQSFAQLPDWDWAKGYGGTQSDNGYNVAVDNDGNVYTVGRFSGTNIAFGGFTLSSNGLDNLFVIKQNTFGIVLWVVPGEGTVAAHTVSISLDQNNNVFITGSFTSASFKLGTSTIINSSTGKEDLFTAKLDSAGDEQWLVQAGNTGRDFPGSIKVDHAGNPYITGFFQSSTITFGSTKLSNAGYRDIYLTKYDTNGNVVWAKSFGGNDWDLCHDISFDQSDNIYLSGAFMSTTITFGPITLTDDSPPNVFSLFFVKLDSLGNAKWAKSTGSTGSDEVVKIANDQSNNCYISGYFSSPSLQLGDSLFINSGSTDIFLAKYDSNGNFIWAKRIGDDNEDLVEGMVLDTINSSIIISGFYNSSQLSFGGITINNNGNNDVFVALYDTAGNAIDAVGIGGNNDDECWSAGGNLKTGIAITGNYSSSAIEFSPYLLTNPQPGIPDIFIARMFKEVILATELLSFNGELTTRNSVQLTWNIINGSNSDHFNVERSLDGTIFQKIGLVKSGNGNAHGPYLYNDLITDISNNQILYYRLKIIDKNGRSSFSNIITIKINNESQYSLKLYPNPANDWINLEYGTLVSNTEAVIINSAGMIVKHIILNAGTTQSVINIHSFAKGVYFLKMVNAGEKANTKKFVKE